MSAETRIRAAVAKAVLAQVEALNPRRVDSVLRQVPVPVQSTIKDSLGLGWLPASDYHLLVNPLFKVLGADAFRALYTDVYVKLAELPILSSITRTALRLGGATPLGLAKYAPPAWQHLSSGIGELTLLSLTTSPHLRYSGYPTYLGPAEIFAYAWAGTFDGFYRLCGSDQHAEIDSLDTEAGSATFSLL